MVNANPGETVNAGFSIRNNASKPIRIYGANTSCGCTGVVGNFPVGLPPGGTARILVHMTIPPRYSGSTFTESANLLVDTEGMVPPLVVQASVQHSSHEE
jgi:hypothetical protein